MTKCKGGCQMKAGGKTCAKCGCDMSPKKMANGGETYKSGGMACMKCGGKMHKSGGTISSCMKCGGGKYTFGGKTGWYKKKNDVSKYKSGGITKPVCPPGYILNAKGECVIDTQYAIDRMYENDNKPDKEYDVNAIKNKVPYNHSLEWNIAEAIDPTGITSWPDVYETWTDGKLDYNDFTEPLGALPLIGRLGKITKAFKGAPPKTVYNKWYDGLGLFGNTIDSSQDIYNDNIKPTKKYQFGGVADNTLMTSDAEIQLGRGAINAPEPTYDARVMSNESPMQVTDNVSQGTEQLGYKDIVKSFQKKTVDKSLPNWGYAKQEQIKLNELIRKDISTGNAKMDLLVEDDIIGDNTLKAMRAYESSGNYTRPEGFKDKWLAEYKKQWDKNQKSKSLIENQETETQSLNPNESSNTFSSNWAKKHFGANSNTKTSTTPKEKESFNFPSMSDVVSGMQSGINYGVNAFGNFIQGAGEFIEKYQNKNEQKSESKSQLDEMYNFFNPFSQKPTNKPVGYGTVLRPEESNIKVKSMAGKYSAEKYSQKISGWPKSALIKEGGIEINAKDLKRKDLDTYFPIFGISKSKKGVRATGRDNNQAFFDAVEKEQTKTKDGSINTSLQFIDKLLSSSSKAIVIPKPGQTYGRDLMDIYLQDPNYPDRFHALDSLGVVEGEAIFGKTIIPTEGTLSERQKLITKQAEEKGGFKYLESPSIFRKTNTNKKEKPLSSNFETPETENEIISRQTSDNQRYGKFMSRGKDIANRTDVKRNADSESFFADYAEPNSVIIDIGSALGNTNPSLAGISVKELASNQSIKKKGIKVIATDIPSEVKTFKMHQRNKQAYDIDYSEVPVTYNTPIDQILKSKDLNDKENVYLRSANSIDLLMNPEETKEHFKHLASTLKDKNVTYVFNNVILMKPKGSSVFSKIGNINNAAYDHNAASWKLNANRRPYTLTTI